VRFGRTLLAALATVLALAGCGPPSPKRPNHFELEPTRGCLEDQGLRVTQSHLGLIMGTAPNGAIYVTLDNGKRVLIGFGNTDRDAADLVKAFEQVTPPSGQKRLKSLLEPRGNVLIQWIDEPSKKEIELVHNCLEG
jgi:hypothetical protein